jgi:glutamate synthase domain-containing protein 1
MEEEERRKATSFRVAYAGLLMNGPFAVILAHHGEMAGLVDRMRLRPLTAAVAKGNFYLSSEESAIRLVHPDLDRVWSPNGGEMVSGKLGGGIFSSTETLPLEGRS